MTTNSLGRGHAGENARKHVQRVLVQEEVFARAAAAVVVGREIQEKRGEFGRRRERSQCNREHDQTTERRVATREPQSINANGAESNTERALRTASRPSPEW